jgi:predicted nucleic acid-binding protein
MDGVSETEIPVVTLAELTVGVFIASDADRPARLATLSAVEPTWDPLPVDAEVARQFARIVAARRADGRRIPIPDALVAATALSEQIPVVTQD